MKKIILNELYDVKELLFNPMTILLVFMILTTAFIGAMQ